MAAGKRQEFRSWRPSQMRITPHLEMRGEPRFAAPGAADQTIQWSEARPQRGKSVQWTDLSAERPQRKQRA